MPNLVTLLEATTSTVKGSFLPLTRGRWKIALSLDSTNVAEIVTLFEKDNNGDERVIAKSGAAINLTEADPATEYASGGQTVAAKLGDGSELATVTATKIGP